MNTTTQETADRRQREWLTDQMLRLNDLNEVAP